MIVSAPFIEKPPKSTAGKPASTGWRRSCIILLILLFAGVYGCAPPLKQMILRSKFDAVKECIAKGVNPQSQDVRETLDIAMYAEQMDIVWMLVDRGVGSYPTLKKAVETSNLELIQKLLANAEGKTYFGFQRHFVEYVLMDIAVRNRDLKTAALLFKQGFEFLKNRGRFALYLPEGHKSMGYGEIKLGKMPKASGPPSGDIDYIEDDSYFTNTDYYLDYSLNAQASAFNAVVSVEATGRSPLGTAILDGNPEMVMLILQFTPPGEVNRPFVLVDSHIFGHQTNWPEGVLKTGSIFFSDHMLKTMSIRITREYTATYLITAIRHRRKQQARTIQLLLWAGADPNIKDSLGKDAWDWARESGDPELLDLLENR